MARGLLELGSMAQRSGSCALFVLLATSPLVAACGQSSEESDTASAGSGNGANGGSATGGSATGGSANGGSANGGSATGGSATGGSGGMQDVDACDGLPRAGQACALGSQCQVPGSPCGSLFTCRDGAWTEEVRCPPTPTCPDARPEPGTACQSINPAAGLTCYYEDGCGNVTATCEASSWRLAPALTEECRALCQDFCVPLAGCGIDWADECIPLCELEYLCPGESPGHDAAICEAERAALSADCDALCESAAFAPSCP